MPDLDLVVEQLCAPSSLETVLHHPLHDSPMPSLEELGEIMSRLKATLFPGYFGVSCVHVESMRYHLSANLDSIFRKLAEQIRRGGCFACASYATDCMSCEEVSMRKAMEFMQRLPHIRRLLASDAKAAYEGDPAATSAGETIFCYPSLLTMTHHRIAHELYNLGVPVIPRIISEMAHSATGIDIHPGATIDEESAVKGNSITKADLYDLGLIGPDSVEKRKALCKRLELPEHLSANALVEVLNLLMSREELQGLFQ